MRAAPRTDIRAGEVLTHAEMCWVESTSLQRGMNFRLHGRHSVILMSVRPGAPYADELRNAGRVLIYEGHDAARNVAPNPKLVDQPEFLPSGKPTENGKFRQAALAAKAGTAAPDRVRVYEKIKDGIWVYNGVFALVDAWQQFDGTRQVFKFELQLLDDETPAVSEALPDLAHNRLIPAAVKQAVWKRDKGRCVSCGSPDNLHFDHIIPFSKGGSSLTADNIQLLCARHNLAKHAHIQ
ncbi:HNH endonuclease [Hymenobacter sp. 15J16-1T3B]|uniref:HNH endonuclease n=1 Tax=Hymenobacter sp. 15J16-1T3B TaxID=2886941 RepID=UPI001D0F4FBF|nr:HNH endonuclease signature motif containing protein [Hymenobacter sp. 15J16-1T3B]MCC3160072.1 HNH endonuclease [Hymenobacter sp. 15J16-1T3B]